MKDFNISLTESPAEWCKCKENHMWTLRINALNTLNIRKICTSKNCCNYPKISVVLPYNNASKNADGMAISVDPDQTRSSLILPSLSEYLGSFWYTFFREDGIKGLEGKMLEFLGLLDCSDDPSHRQNVPAKRVSLFSKFSIFQPMFGILEKKNSVFKLSIKF